MSKMGHAKDGPWMCHFSEMGRKTTVRRICKYLPMSAELEKALELDSRSGEFDFSVIDEKAAQAAGSRADDLGKRLTDDKNEPDKPSQQPAATEPSSAASQNKAAKQRDQQDSLLP